MDASDHYENLSDDVAVTTTIQQSKTLISHIIPKKKNQNRFINGRNFIPINHVLNT